MVITYSFWPITWTIPLPKSVPKLNYFNKSSKFISNVHVNLCDKYSF